MNCRHARSDLALWVGRDLTDTQRREELRRHVSRCPECRSHYARLKQTLRVLENADETPTYDAAASLWPELSGRIQQRAASRGPTSRFNGWFPFVAMTAACALLVVVMETRPAQRPTPGIGPISKDFLIPWRPVQTNGPPPQWEPPVATPTLDEPPAIVNPDPDSTPETAPGAPSGF
jgi:hypothetical protein